MQGSCRPSTEGAEFFEHMQVSCHQSTDKERSRDHKRQSYKVA